MMSELERFKLHYERQEDVPLSRVLAAWRRRREAKKSKKTPRR